MGRIIEAIKAIDPNHDVTDLQDQLPSRSKSKDTELDDILSRHLGEGWRSR
jgi:hypothetical protein